jgi:hypothetical protein
MKPFFVVLARDDTGLDKKVVELKKIGLPYLIVCGKNIQKNNLIYRKPVGKYDAINFGLNFVPPEFDTIIFNDVDTKINHFDAALKKFNAEKLDLLFAGVKVVDGPQQSFYVILDFIRRRLPITSSGELMVIRREFLNRILPIKPCKAEDSFMLFKALELKQHVAFCEKCYVKTVRTTYGSAEQAYKRRTVCGIYQALEFSKPTLSIRIFYMILPLITPCLLVFGNKGYYWMRGINLGLKDYLQGDKEGVWVPS